LKRAVAVAEQNGDALRGQRSDARDAVVVEIAHLNRGIFVEQVERVGREGLAGAFRSYLRGKCRGPEKNGDAKGGAHGG